MARVCTTPLAEAKRAPRVTTLPSLAVNAAVPVFVVAVDALTASRNYENPVSSRWGEPQSAVYVEVVDGVAGDVVVVG